MHNGPTCPPYIFSKSLNTFGLVEREKYPDNNDSQIRLYWSMSFPKSGMLKGRDNCPLSSEIEPRTREEITFPRPG